MFTVGNLLIISKIYKTVYDTAIVHDEPDSSEPEQTKLTRDDLSVSSHRNDAVAVKLARITLVDPSQLRKAFWIKTVFSAAIVLCSVAPGPRQHITTVVGPAVKQYFTIHIA